MHCNTSSSPRSSNANANAPREVAPFLKSLRRMLQDESDAVLRWTPDGRAFEIHDMDGMMQHVLPKYFKHCKYTSFQRQLNYFNFRKWTKSKAVVCTFSNDFFLRDQPELAWRITRKKSLSPSQQKYRPVATRASIVPCWKREPVAVLSAPHPTGLENMLPPGDNRYRLPFPEVADNALLLKQVDVRHVQLSRRYNGFNMGAPASEPYAASTRSYDLPAGNNCSGEQTEPLDWIDCLLPPTDDTYMCMYPPPSAVAPFTVNPVNLRKSFEFATL